MYVYTVPPEVPLGFEKNSKIQFDRDGGMYASRIADTLQSTASSSNP